MTTLSARLGEQLRQWRERHKLPQDEVASLARRWGFDWTRSVVAAIEAGRRALSVEEFLLLPWLAGNQGPKATKRGEPAPMELADLFSGLGWVPLTRTFIADEEAFRAIVEGRATKSDLSTVIMDVPTTRQSLHEAALAGIGENTAVLDHLHLRDLPDARQLLEAAHVDKQAEAEMQAARRLRTFPLAVAAAARKRWGRSLTEERDRRVAEQTPADAIPRTLQALRGHVTRALLEELRQDVEGVKAAKHGRTRSGRRRRARRGGAGVG